METPLILALTGNVTFKKEMDVYDHFFVLFDFKLNKTRWKTLCMWNWDINALSDE